MTVTVRLAPLPPRTRLPLGISVVSLELAATTRVPAAVSGSKIVNVIGPLVLSSSMNWSATAPMLGASSISVTSMVKVLSTDNPPESVERTVTW